MSANNYILVEETDKDFKITQRDYDNNHQLGKPRKAKTLREALLKAQDLKDGEWFPVEYGIEVDLVESKSGGIKE